MINAIFLTLLSWCPVDSPPDSLRLETINGKVFIIHQVAEKETLYSISRRYGTPITAILEFNAKATSNLEVGQLIQVPYVPKVKPANKEGTVHKVAVKETLFSISKMYNVSIDDLKEWNNLKDYNLSVGQELIVKKTGSNVKTVTTPEPRVGTGSHVVEQKETLFSISKLFGITVQQLKDWNHIQGDDVKVGQTLVVADPSKQTVTEPVKNPVVIKEDPKPVNQENTIHISESINGNDEVKEGGLAELIDGTEGNRKYLALHRTIKPGSIIKVRNELNNREVFVRIVGPLPDTGINDKIIIKISRSAYDRLGAIDPKFRVEVTYYK